MTNYRTLTVAAVMARTGFPRSTVYRLVKAGKLTALREAGRNARIRILESSLDAYFAQATQGRAQALDAEADRRAVGEQTDRAVLPDGPRIFG